MNTYKRQPVRSIPKTNVDPSIFINFTAIHIRSIRNICNSSKRHVFPYPFSPTAIGPLPKTICHLTSYRYGARLPACPDWTRLLSPPVPAGQQLYMYLLYLGIFFLLMLVKVLWYWVIWSWLWNCYLFCVKFVVVYFEVGFYGFRGNWVILGFNWVFCGNVKIEMWICDYKIDYILIGSELILLEKRKFEMIIYLFNLAAISMDWFWFDVFFYFNDLIRLSYYVSASAFVCVLAFQGEWFCSVFEQAQQLFQRDAQTITPEALEGVKAALASSEIEHKAETKKKAVPRKAAGLTWEDPTLAEWPESMLTQSCFFELFNKVNILIKCLFRWYWFCSLFTVFHVFLI